MRKKLALAVATALAAGVVVAGFVLSGSATAAGTLKVIEHAVSDHVTDVGKEGLSRGDLLTFHNPIYDATDTDQVGRDQGSCIRLTETVGKKSSGWECEWTTFLDDGSSSITVESPFYDTGLGTGAITGGTGTYIGASGSLDLSCTETECTFVFNFA